MKLSMKQKVEAVVGPYRREFSTKSANVTQREFSLAMIVATLLAGVVGVFGNSLAISVALSLAIGFYLLFRFVGRNDLDRKRAAAPNRVSR